MAKRARSLREPIVESSGNVFADLGFKDAETRQTKVRLATAIHGIIDRLGLTQAQAASQLGISQPKVSALLNYELEGFSVERLMHFLTALDQDVEIVNVGVRGGLLNPFYQLVKKPNSPGQWWTHIIKEMDTAAYSSFPGRVV